MRIYFLFLCLNRVLLSLMKMDHFYKSYAKTDLASLHYVTFIESLAIFSTEALSFDFDDFTVNFMKKVIEGNINNSFILLEEHFFDAILLYKKIMRWNLKTCHMKHNKVYRIKFIIITFVLHMYILIARNKFIYPAASRGVID
jgi:hypothetical protein